MSSRAVDDQLRAPLLVVFADVGQGLGKMRIGHIGHGDQEMVREVHRLHFLGMLFAPPCPDHQIGAIVNVVAPPF